MRRTSDQLRSMLVFLIAGVVVAVGAPNAEAVAPTKTVYSACVKAGVKAASKPVTAAKLKAIKKRCARKAVGSGLSVNANGVVTALPSNFPKNPTAADIAALGLTPDTKVSPNLRLPEPSGPAYAPAQLAAKVRPVGTIGGSTMTTWLDSNDNPVSRPMTIVEWEFTGGSGVVLYSTQDTPGGPITRHYTKLNPNGTTRILQSAVLIPDEDGRIIPFFSGEVVPDYGQANVPASTIYDWTLPAAKDKSGIGMPVGVNANPGFWDQYGAPRDGWVQMTPDGTMIGNYNY